MGGGALGGTWEYLHALTLTAPHSIIPTLSAPSAAIQWIYSQQRLYRTVHQEHIAMLVINDCVFRKLLLSVIIKVLINIFYLFEFEG